MKCLGVAFCFLVLFFINGCWSNIRDELPAKTPVESSFIPTCKATQGIFPRTLSANQSLPTNLAVITMENANCLYRIARWGNGITSPWNNPAQLTWSTDGKIIAVPTSLGVFLFDAETLEPTNSLNEIGFNNAIRSDLKFIARPGIRGLEIWEVATNKLVDRLPMAATKVQYAPDGKSVIVATSGAKIEVWSVEPKSKLATFQVGKNGTEIVKDMSASRDGQRVAAIDDIGWHDVSVWFVPSNSIFRTITDSSLKHTESVALSPNGKLLAISHSGVKLWDIESGELLYTLKPQNTATFQVVFSPNGELVAASNWDSVMIWRVADGKLVREIKDAPRSISGFAFSPDSAQIVTVDSARRLKRWQVSDGEVLQSHSDLADQGWVSSIAFSPDSNSIVSASLDNRLKLWNAQNGTVVTETVTTPYPNMVAFSPSGSLVANIAGSDIELRQASDLQLVRTIKAGGEIRQIAFSPDGELLAAAHGASASVWRVDSGELIQQFDEQKAPVETIAFSPDGQWIASGGGLPPGAESPSTKAAIYVWRLSDRQIKFERKNYSEDIHSTVFSPDGRRLVASDKDLHVWNLDDGKLIFNFSGRVSNNQLLKFNPDGELLALGAGLYRFDNMKRVGQVYGENEQINAIAFSADGTRIATAGQDGTISIWGVASQ